MRGLVIGVGSPNGDEAVGLHVAARLAQEELPEDVLVLARERPGLALLDDLEGAPVVVLVDALRSGDTPGVVRRLSYASLEAPRSRLARAVLVAEVLSHAIASGRRLPPLRIVGVEIALATGDSLSPAVAAALGTACAATRAALTELLGD